MYNTDISAIFDFNGTILFDKKLHDEAWKQYIEELAPVSISSDDVDQWISGRSPKFILEHFLGYELNDNMVFQLSGEKERIYRSLLVKQDLPLSPGVEEFFNFLLLAQIKRAIITTAHIENVNLYFERYNLEKWFKWEDIIIGSSSNSTPDLYKAAIKKIDMPADKIVVFEDSDIGTASAEAAGISHIIGITGDSHNRKIIEHPGVMACVEYFTELPSIEVYGRMYP